MARYETTERESDVGSGRDPEVLDSSSQAIASGRAATTPISEPSSTRSRWLLEDILLSGHAPAWMVLPRESAFECIALERASEKDFR